MFRHLGHFFFYTSPGLQSRSAVVELTADRGVSIMRFGFSIRIVVENCRYVTAMEHGPNYNRRISRKWRWVGRVIAPRVRRRQEFGIWNSIYGKRIATGWEVSEHDNYVPCVVHSFVLQTVCNMRGVWGKATRAYREYELKLRYAMHDYIYKILVACTPRN